MQFDVDSEVFELTIAMMKQKSEERYQELIEYIFDKINEEIKVPSSKWTALNILILGMQVIDDELYKCRLVQLLIDNRELIIKNKKNIDNNSILVNLIMSNNEYLDKINEAYKEFNVVNMLRNFTEDFINVCEFSKDNKINLIETDNIRYPHGILCDCNEFYIVVYYLSKKMAEDFSNLNIDSIDKICKDNNIKKKEKEKIKKLFSKYLNTEEEKRERLKYILVG